MAERVEITESFRDKIRAEITRTGLGPQAILRGRKDKPVKLNASMISNILSGAVNTATREIYDYLSTLWDVNPAWVAIDNALRDRMKAEWERTGVGPTDLVRHFPQDKHYLKAKVHRWVNGDTKQARQDELDLAMDIWEKLPNKKAVKPVTAQKSLTGPPSRHYNTYENISAEDLAVLREERKRTGMGGRKLWHHAENPPAFLDYFIVQSWLDGGVKSAPPEHVRYVLDLYKSLPDRQK